jgi:hypothetical protein
MIWPEKYLFVRSAIRIEKALCRILAPYVLSEESKSRAKPSIAGITTGGDDEYSG